MAIRTKSPTSPMSGLLPATPPHGIRIGSWLAREARNNVISLRRCVAVLMVAAVAQALLLPILAVAARYHTHREASGRIPPRALPYPQLDLPLQISGSQYIPLNWADVPGWIDDDQLAAFQAFRTSCRSIAAQHDVTADARALGTSLRDPCRAAPPPGDPRG